MDEWLTMSQVAKMLGISEQHMRRSRGKNGIPAGFQRAPGTRVLYKRSEIERLISPDCTKQADKPHGC